MQSKFLVSIGEYTQLMGRVFTLPMRWRMFHRSVLREVYSLGVGSMWIVFIISFFIGAVITIQLSINMTSPLIPRFTIGYSSREIMILEFSSTVMCLILSGKVGSSIASELGAKTYEINPLDGDWQSELLKIANALSQPAQTPNQSTR